MGIFSRKEKRKPQVIDINNEIHRVGKYMWEYEGAVESISVDKILITERDHNAILSGISKIIVEVIEREGQGLDKTQLFQAISRGQNLASRIIDKLYDVDWIY